MSLLYYELNLKNIYQSPVKNTDLFINIFVKEIKNPNQFNQVLWQLHFDLSISSPRLNVHIEENV